MPTILVRLLSITLTLYTLPINKALSQDVVYFSNDGSSVYDTRLTGITDTKAILTVARKGITREVVFSRSRIALAFTKTGNFLLMSELATDATLIRAQLQAFLSITARPATYDFLIKTSPFRVIPAQIAYENDEIVNYTTPNGNAAAIPKSALSVILYRDGHHKLIASVADAAPLLLKAREALNDTSFIASSVMDTVPPDEQRDSLMNVGSEFIDQGNVPVSTTDTPTNPITITTLSAAQKELYQQQSLAQVDEFVSYLSVITDQSVDNEIRDKALKAASHLFLPGSIIEVTSTRRPGVRRYSVRLYLTRLKLLPYLSTRIDLVQTQFIRDLASNPDGTYSGIVMGHQTFSGYGATGQPTYSDLTPKYVRVRLSHIEQPISGPNQWRVLLGNIRVAAD